MKIAKKNKHDLSQLSNFTVGMIVSLHTYEICLDETLKQVELRGELFFNNI